LRALFSSGVIAHVGIPEKRERFERKREKGAKDASNKNLNGIRSGASHLAKKKNSAPRSLAVERIYRREERQRGGVPSKAKSRPLE